MNIIITGGTGFLGSKLAEKFIKKGHKVTIIDINKNISYYRKKYLKKTKFYLADITSINSLTKLKFKKNSVLLHCAGQPSAALSFSDPESDMKKNIVGMLNIINLAKLNKFKKIIFASTFNVYKENNKLPKLKETSLCEPKSLLSVSKLAAENYLKIYSTHLGIKWNILRMFNVYGPGQDPNNPNLGMISIFLNMAKKKDIINVKGSLKRFRDFIYIDDVVDAWYKLALDKNNINQTYNLGSGKKTTIEQLFNIISAIIKKKLIIKEEKGTPGDFIGCYADVNKIKKDIKFIPKTDLITGLRKFNIWLNENKK